MGVAMVIWLY